jgi:undecaprenyl-diphosphatase
LVDRLSPRARGLLIGAGSCALLVALVWALAADITGSRLPAPLDLKILTALYSLRTPGLDRLMMAMSALGDGGLRTSATVLIVCYLLWRRRLAWAGGLAVAMIAAGILTPTLKTAFHIARPTPLYAGAESFSFPSGHAISSAALYILLAWIASRSLEARGRVVTWGLAILMILLTGVSRVYVGAHWPSDVVAGWMVGSILAIGGLMIASGVGPSPSRESRHGPHHAGPILACLLMISLTLGPGAYGKASRLYGPYLRDGVVQSAPEMSAGG